MATSAYADVIRKHDSLSNLESGSIRVGQKGITSAGATFVTQVLRHLVDTNYYRWTCDDGQVLMFGNQSVSGVKTFENDIVVTLGNLIRNSTSESLIYFDELLGIRIESDTLSAISNSGNILIKSDEDLSLIANDDIVISAGDLSTNNILIETGGNISICANAAGPGNIDIYSDDDMRIVVNSGDLFIDAFKNIEIAGDAVYTDCQLSATQFSTGDSYFTYEEGSFTADYMGFTNPQTATIWYAKIGNFVTLVFQAMIATSNSTSFVVSAIPSNLRPSAGIYVHIMTAYDNGAFIDLARLYLNPTGIWDFQKWTGSSYSPTGWTSAGTKGIINQGTSISYLVF